MTEWLNLSDTDRVLTLNQASAKSGLPCLFVRYWIFLDERQNDMRMKIIKFLFAKRVNLYPLSQTKTKKH